MDNVNPQVQETHSSSDWDVYFNVPDAKSFSSCIQHAINTGIVTAKARREFTQVLHTHMIVHTINPTSEQYVTICRKLIVKYPKLEDEKGNAFVRGYSFSYIYKYNVFVLGFMEIVIMKRF